MKKILIVDDDELILDLFSELLSQHGFEVYTANDVNSGYQEYQAHEPDIVISDIVMKESTGFDLYNRVKMLNPNVKFIFMTGYDYDKTIVDKIKSLKTKWIAKPIKFEELIKLIESVE